jgi:hypothetical protein
VLSNCEERLIHEEAKKILSRFWSYLYSKLGYGGGDLEMGEAIGCVKDIHVIDNFIALITNKDLIMLRKSDGVKMYENDYLEQIKETAFKNDQFTNINVMRQILEFRMINSSAVNFSARNALCINFYILRS